MLHGIDYKQCLKWQSINLNLLHQIKDINSYYIKQCSSASSTLLTEDLSPLVCSKLGRISLIDILDTVAPLSTHILSLTPSAPWLNSSLAHEQRQNRWSGHLHFPSFKKKKSQTEFWLAPEDRTMLWLTWLHVSDEKWSLKWIHMKRTHRLHGGARLKLRIMLPVNQIFPTCLLQNMPLYKTTKSLLKQLWCITEYNTTVRLVLYIPSSSCWNKHLTWRKIHLSCQVPPSVFPQSTLFRLAAFRCVHFEARLQINVMTSSCGSLPFI